MKLVEYIRWKSTNVHDFAKQIGVSPLTLYRLIKGQDCFASTLFAIYDATNGAVGWSDMRPSITRTKRQSPLGNPVLQESAYTSHDQSP